MNSRLEKSVMIFKALADETRMIIVDTLFSGEKTVSQIIQYTKVSQSCVSHQLHFLKTLNIVKSERRGKCVYYSLADEHIKYLIEQTFLHAEEDLYEKEV